MDVERLRDKRLFSPFASLRLRDFDLENCLPMPCVLSFARPRDRDLENMLGVRDRLEFFLPLSGTAVSWRLVLRGSESEPEIL